MKSLSDLLYKTPWWALLVAAFACLIALAAFVTPYHIIDYRAEGDTDQERRAIKREIDNAFAENAIDIAHGVIRGMRRSTKDPERRAELDEALRGLQEARQELRDAGAEVLRAKRDALEQSRDAARTAMTRLEEARREIEVAMSKGGPQNAEARRALDDAIKAAAEAQARVEAEAATTKPRKRIRIGVSGDSDKPLVDIDVGEPQPGEKQGLHIESTPDTPKVPSGKPGKGVPPPLPGSIAAPPSPPSAPAPGAMPSPPSPGAAPSPPSPPSEPLPPEFRDRIRQNVTGDMYRIGIGAALALILLPMFVLAVIAKFFIDRSRAATRMADLKRKEAEHHRMSQQLTEAKLQALQAQVEPHFLYNTLASVQALTEVDPAQANAMTGHLIQYLRNALPKMREGISTVGQEIELVRAYLSILQMRMGKRLAFEINVPESLNAIAFPPLMLPSLVENAIKHGLEPQREGGTVNISAELVEGRLRLIVADTGRGFGETIGAGVGLANIRERLAALYGDTAKLTLVENTPKGVVATIDVPADAARAASAAQAAQAATAATKQADAPAEPAIPLTRTARFLGVLAAVERFWRRALIYFFYALVILAAVFAFVGIVGVVTGAFPVQIEDEIFSGPGGSLLGTAAVLLAFVVCVVAIAIVVAVIYGLGFLFVALTVLMALIFLAGISPVLAPIILVGLAIWWFMRKKEPKVVEQRVEPTL
ncbi:hypothetical protein DSM104443_04092 [Usitatibacter rugosus]|uniref:Histidine kinase/HSP90-like ATPase domain-containing protein n=1 Tax=Usitatibacter rugosus TaxID=2732067 RepID=A0A6M4H1J1_9PROT|nr:histidine kinase [Usitatibacter rugosus]QJR12998.1 hypothetical protein DSM104443_04092 [Usitatibacter rugosus]